jgi:hypothetical protein
MGGSIQLAGRVLSMEGLGVPADNVPSLNQAPPSALFHSGLRSEMTGGQSAGEAADRAFVSIDLLCRLLHRGENVI